jgi:hypothetical protein
MMLPVLQSTAANGKPLLKCPTCGATSDASPFAIDATAGMAECRETRSHSLPAKGKLKDFDPDKKPDTEKP